ncbi:unnamed protein product [Onchocerca flexuosa]|uniref:DUF3828 domain-containing protein n=1 Tax=Onchocerca flexuosa TaxID=387005 RepID=A0A183HJ46_9BILA|nr:unnamed protein product [Onchocerca flexuosa]
MHTEYLDLIKSEESPDTFRNRSGKALHIEFVYFTTNSIKMPKIIKGNGKWKAVDISGECIGDDNFTFLSSIEEYIPTEEHTNASSLTVFPYFRSLFLPDFSLFSLNYTAYKCTL